MQTATPFNQTDYAKTEHAAAQAEWRFWLTQMQTAKTKTARRDAAEKVEFWGNKMAFLSHAK